MISKLVIGVWCAQAKGLPDKDELAATIKVWLHMFDVNKIHPKLGAELLDLAIEERIQCHRRGERIQALTVDYILSMWSQSSEADYEDRIKLKWDSFEFFDRPFDTFELFRAAVLKRRADDEAALVAKTS